MQISPGLHVCRGPSRSGPEKALRSGPAAEDAPRVPSFATPRIKLNANGINRRIKNKNGHKRTYLHSHGPRAPALIPYSRASHGEAPPPCKGRDCRGGNGLPLLGRPNDGSAR